MSYTMGFELEKSIIHLTEMCNMNAADNLLVLKNNSWPVCELHALFLLYMFLNLWCAAWFNKIG